MICGAMGALAGQPVRKGMSTESRHCPLIASLVMSILSTIGSFCLGISFLVFLAVGIDWLVDCKTIGVDSAVCDDFQGQNNSLLAAYFSFSLIAFVTSFAQCIASGVNICKFSQRTTVTTYVTSTMPVVVPVNQPYPPAGVVYSTTPIS